MPNQLYRNLGNGRFEDVSARAGAVFQRCRGEPRRAPSATSTTTATSTCSSATAAGPTRLLINNVGNRNHWVGLRLVGAHGRGATCSARGCEVLRDGGTPLLAPRAIRRQLRVGQRSARARRARARRAGGGPGPGALAGRAHRGVAVGPDRALDDADAGAGEVRRPAERAAWARRIVSCAAGIAIVALAGCKAPASGPAPGATPAASTSAPVAPGSRPVTLPDLSRVEAQVQQQAKERYDELQRGTAAPGRRGGRARAGLRQPGDAAARRRVPRRGRAGLPERPGSGAAGCALAVPPGPSAQEQGQPVAGARRFHPRARARAERRADADLAGPSLSRSGRAGEGAAALRACAGRCRRAWWRRSPDSGRRRWRSATIRAPWPRSKRRWRVQPTAASVHSPLAMAYRGLGDTAKAEAHLKQWRNTDVLVPDPVRQQLDLSLQSGLSFELRGVRALEAASAAQTAEARQQSLKAAEGFFRKGIPLAPGDTMLGRSLRHKLATALVLSGDVRGAVERFEEVVRFAPQDGRRRDRRQGALQPRRADGVGRARRRRHPPLLGRGEVQSQLPRGPAGAGRCVEPRGAAASRPWPSTRRSSASIPAPPTPASATPSALVRQKRYREARDWLAEATAAAARRPAAPPRARAPAGGRARRRRPQRHPGPGDRPAAARDRQDDPARRDAGHGVRRGRHLFAGPGRAAGRARGRVAGRPHTPMRAGCRPICGSTSAARPAARPGRATIRCSLRARRSAPNSPRCCLQRGVRPAVKPQSTYLSNRRIGLDSNV